MNREDIIRMAREAGIIHPEMVDKTLERFATLVASAEHKRVQQVYTDAATDSVKAAIAYEREACAKECDIQASFGNDDERFGARQCGYAIRARGQA